MLKLDGVLKLHRKPMELDDTTLGNCEQNILTCQVYFLPFAVTKYFHNATLPQYIYSLCNLLKKNILHLEPPTNV